MMRRTVTTSDNDRIGALALLLAAALTAAVLLAAVALPADAANAQTSVQSELAVE